MNRFYFTAFVVFILSCNNNEPAQKLTAQSNNWPLLPFYKADAQNPVMIPDSLSVFLCPVRNTMVHWEEKDVFNPAAIVRHDTVFLLYRAEDKIGKYAGTSRIGLAWSTDGLHFTKHPVPVLYPDNDSLKKWEWEGGCEDPRIVENEHGSYILTYTAYDGDKARLLVASSNDLYHWTKHGSAFKNDSAAINKWSKSGAIVCKMVNNPTSHSASRSKIIAAKVNGRYWMYFGDTHIFLASSEDLIHWYPVSDSAGNWLPVCSPREGKFDSDLVEPGPPALLTNDGILLIYNSRNVPSKGDQTLPEGTYTASQILFDRNDPQKILHRLDTFFLKPDQPYEINGQVNRVCFTEGLVPYKGQWFLYYGTADSKIAAAVKKE